VWRAAFDEAEDESIRLLAKGDGAVRVDIHDLLLDELLACPALSEQDRMKATKGFGR
jgi:hypothetical protein